MTIPGTMGKKLFIQTFGCQMNEHDSEKIAGVLAPLGWTRTDRLEEADLVIFNTCSVREKAEQKTYSQLGWLRRLKRRRPDLLIGVGGCVAQQEGARILERAPYVDLVFGTDNIHELPRLLEARLRQGRGVVETQRRRRRPEVSPLRRPGVRAWVTVVDGCDKFCTFCVVPHTRGRERSRDPEAIVREVEALAREGFREVCLLGQNVSAYGRDLPQPTTLAALLYRIHDIPGIARIRFLTSHPLDVDEALARAMGELPKVCEQLHLPLQAGSDRILQAMRRGYTLDQYRKTVEMLRKWVPGLALSTDLIVGFPGEQEADFEATLRAVEEFQFDQVYAFKYSPRPFTPAATYPDQVPEAVKEVRLQRLLDLANRQVLSRHRQMVGRVEEVLFEGADRKGRGRLSGRTRTHHLVHVDVPDPQRWVGQLVPVRITEAHLGALYGEVTHPAA